MPLFAGEGGGGSHARGGEVVFTASGGGVPPFPPLTPTYGDSTLWLWGGKTRERRDQKKRKRSRRGKKFNPLNNFELWCFGRLEPPMLLYTSFGRLSLYLLVSLLNLIKRNVLEGDCLFSALQTD